MICLCYILLPLGYYRNVTPISDFPLLPILTRYLNKPTHALPSDAVHAWEELPINIYLPAALLSLDSPFGSWISFWAFVCLVWIV